MATAVSSYGVNQYVNRMAGVDTHFSWDSMAAQVVGSLAGQQVAPNSNNFAAKFGRGVVASATTAKLNQQWAKGAQANYGQIALDAFGSAVGNSLAESLVVRLGIVWLKVW